MRCAGSRGVRLQGPLDQFKDFGFFSLGLTKSLEVWAKGSQDPKRITMAVLSKKSAKGTLDRRLLYKSVSKDFSRTSRMGTHVQG